MNISAIIPTHNRSDLLRHSVRSVLNQTRACMELIVIDDGSTDNTREVVEELRGNSSIPLVYLHQENQGKSVALNRAIERVRGDWIAFLDSDDEWLPQKLERQMDALAEHPACGLCFTDGAYTNNPEYAVTSFQHANRSYGTATGEIQDSLALVLTPPHGIYMQSVLIRTDVMHAIGNFDPELWITQDTDFIFRAAVKARFCFVNQPLVKIDRTPDRKHGLIEQLNSERVRLREREHMYRKWLLIAQQEHLERSVSGTIRRRLNRVHTAWANYYLRTNDYECAREQMLSAMSYCIDRKDLLKFLLVSVAPELALKTVDSSDGKHSL